MHRAANLFKLFTQASTRRNVFQKVVSSYSRIFQNGYSGSRGLLWLSGAVTVLASTAVLNQRKLSLESAHQPFKVQDNLPSKTQDKEESISLPGALNSRKPSDVVESCFKELLSLGLGERITREEHELETHGSDISFHDKVLPDIVIYPQDTMEVSNILSICNKYKMPVVAYGGATSLEGHILPVRGGVVLDFSNMKRILRVNLQDMDVTVEPGISWNELNDYLHLWIVFSTRPWCWCQYWRNGCNVLWWNECSEIWHNERKCFEFESCSRGWQSNSYKTESEEKFRWL
jgi:hypothetical protein